jgi:transcription-repair coupling factor (superfamily II helicase)
LDARGGRVSVAGLDLGSARVKGLREQLPEAIYESRKQTLSLRAPADDATALLATAGALADALAGSSDNLARS